MSSFLTVAAIGCFAVDLSMSLRIDGDATSSSGSENARKSREVADVAIIQEPNQDLRNMKIETEYLIREQELKVETKRAHIAEKQAKQREKLEHHQREAAEEMEEEMRELAEEQAKLDIARQKLSDIDAQPLSLMSGKEQLELETQKQDTEQLVKEQEEKLSRREIVVETSNSVEKEGSDDVQTEERPTVKVTRKWSIERRHTIEDENETKRKLVPSKATQKVKSHADGAQETTALDEDETEFAKEQAYLEEGKHNVEASPSKSKKESKTESVEKEEVEEKFTLDDDDQTEIPSDIEAIVEQDQEQDEQDMGEVKTRLTRAATISRLKKGAKHLPVLQHALVRGGLVKSEAKRTQNVGNDVELKKDVAEATTGQIATEETSPAENQGVGKTDSDAEPLKEAKEQNAGGHDGERGQKAPASSDNFEADMEPLTPRLMKGVLNAEDESLKTSEDSGIEASEEQLAAIDGDDSLAGSSSAALHEPQK
eukprot:TRINITY_DN326_c0_g2_i1.p1 TRINITY_DN326_c0_g2~~TRINITY_DN326_c0_g2_i1.p1  ORF type:complete len:484 (-),score=129.59 TRINITY_DN326_c0_g2_i1:170-1621(-)